MTAFRLASTIAFLAAAGIACAAGANDRSRNPSGKYCGELLSSGIMTAVETSFRRNADNGTVTGSYVFSEQGQPVEGMLAEAGDDGDRNDLTRTFIWRDKYGYGQLVVIFTPDFLAFHGQWNDGGAIFSPWNGTHCGEATS